ncbi:LptF/LptG family permease [Deinococcus lacus]|uniref:LptF/LptG family permease n=1 Tax=Deinococcus lacus TaxID=392561 RepID=A0ABW1YBQ9_9DEIO
MQLTDLLSQTAGLLLDYHATPAQTLNAFTAQLPVMLNRTLVLAIPFAILLAFGRLQSDSEIKAILAAGVSPLRLVWPLALPFALVGLFTFYNSGWLAPQSQVRFFNAWYDIYGMTPPPQSRELYTYTEGGTLFYAGRVVPPEEGEAAPLSGVMVQRGQEVITASSGYWDTAQKTWTLLDPWVTRTGAAPQLQPGPLTLPQGDTLAPSPPDADKVTTPELQRQLAAGSLEGSAERDARFQLAARAASGVTPVIFALAAGILGLLLRNRAAAFAGVLLFVLLYYVPWTMAPQMAHVGALSPVLAAWLPNLIFVLLAALLAWRLR